MISCLECGDNKIEEVVENNQRYFYCYICKKLYERALTARLGRDVTKNTKYGLQHTSAGAFIRQKNKMLLLKRRSYPFGYDFPAGHVEYNETPEDAVRREVMEETGLKVTQSKLIYQGEMIGNKCKYGADTHVWFFCECVYAKGDLILNPESEAIGWYSKDEALQLNPILSAQFFINKVVQYV